MEELKRTDTHESGRRTSGTGGENHGRTDERIDAHESGRTSGTGGKNHGCTDVIERHDQPSDAYESARSLPARTGQRSGQRTTNNRVCFVFNQFIFLAVPELSS